MKSLLTTKKLTIINFMIVLYFALIFLINYYKIDLVILGVFREMLTIPFLIAQVVFLVIGIKFTLKNSKNFLLLFSLLALGICAVITIGSFF
ncbi:hypothetical protein [Polaribacter pacificus]|uniref:hypothetical protein n=1 Tax=Polaribacter pacificus TaxID=1775173 RepID=UPI00166392A2|nr:hypothetical protein [Polaribacter pacificus]